MHVHVQKWQFSHTRGEYYAAMAVLWEMHLYACEFACLLYRRQVGGDAALRPVSHCDFMCSPAIKLLDQRRINMEVLGWNLHSDMEHGKDFPRMQKIICACSAWTRNFFPSDSDFGLSSLSWSSLCIASWKAGEKVERQWAQRQGEMRVNQDVLRSTPTSAHGCSCPWPTLSLSPSYNL